ncbi:MAG: polyprenyl synthetase family protein [Syntrophomonadaceae bacterium]|nr:polyprenyl synthetase family protein [Syntrophomonadaceae bacterium]
MNLQAEMEKRKLLIEGALEKMMPSEDCRPPVIHQAMRYAVFNGGKRLRPVLVLEGARLMGGDFESVLPIACAVELIHSYSLVHDDLPAMDDDDLRRGKPTCHLVFGEAIAILAGDGLLTLAFELMSQAIGNELTNHKRVLEAWTELAQAAGSKGMIAGQVTDLMSEGQEVNEETLLYTHYNKTGALFKASLKSGAIMSGANSIQLQALEAYAEHFGLAFQITDDILDVEGDELLTGKKCGSDARSEKSTFVSVYGLDQSRKMAEQCVEKAIHSLDIFGEDGELLKGLAFSILPRRK